MPAKYNYTLKQAAQGFMLHIESRRLKPGTLADYANTLRKFQDVVPGDTPLDEITRDQLRRFLSAFPALSAKTILNYHTGLSAFWTWAVDEELAREHIPRQVQPPKPDQREIIPFTHEQIQSMLYACDFTGAYKRAGNSIRTRNRRTTALRDRAIIFLLFDTGLRASELCGIKINEIDLTDCTVPVWGKGGKQRVISFSSKTAKAIWQYLKTRPDHRPAEPLFITIQDNPLDRSQLRKVISTIGKRAGVEEAHPHRFRHTFAIEFLRNGGNIFALQKMLGHSTLDMVKRYLALASTDVAAAHQIASPVANAALR